MEDYIEYFLDNKSLGKAILPEWSTTEIRYEIAKSLGIINYDRVTFITEDKVRLDSSDYPDATLEQECKNYNEGR